MHQISKPLSIFISYSRSDSEFVKRLKSDMDAQGITFWLDREGIKPGEPNWEESLRMAIRNADAVLLVASPHSRSSLYVNDELRIAEMYQRPVYPVWVAGEHWMEVIPIGRGGTEYIDARGSRYWTALPEIVKAFCNLVSAKPLTAPILPLPDFEPRNPFKGLQAFTSKDVGDFFGREAVIEELATALEEVLAMERKGEPYGRLLTLVGPSGSGKSSVVMAGLLPCLQDGGVLDSNEWVYLDSLIPGEHPIESLTLALWEQLSHKSLKTIREDLEDDSVRGLHLLASSLVKRGGKRVVIFIDQFEELFTQSVAEDERRRFIDLLFTAVTEPNGPVIAILTLRADFYDRPMQYPQLGQLIQSHHRLVLPMETKDLRAVIEKPAALSDVQMTFEGDLVGDLLFEVRAESAALPLLQFTLDQMFQRRSGHFFTLQAYREIGGVKGALAKHAESIYSTLPTDEHRLLTRVLFLRLIDLGVTEQDTTRRRAALREMSLPDPMHTMKLQEIVNTFVAARLLTITTLAGIPRVEVSHEALIREWTRLANWVLTDRNDILLQKTISEDAAAWGDVGKPTDRLYRGAQLAEAQAWMQRNVASSDEVAFIQASGEEQERAQIIEKARQARELELQRRATRRQRYVIGMMGVTSVVIVVALLVALLFQRDLLAAQDSLLKSLPVNVTNLNDHGPGSLREAIATAKDFATITFAKNLKGILTLTSGGLFINKNLAINGPGAFVLSISGGSKNRIFEVGTNGIVTISNLTIKNGYISDKTVPGGGAIENAGNLTLVNDMVIDNKAEEGGGAIENGGNLTIAFSTIAHNEVLSRESAGGAIVNIGTLVINDSDIFGNSGYYGGGIYNYSSLSINNSTLAQNSAGYGGAIYNYSKLALNVTDSTIFGNKALSGGGIDEEGGAISLTFCTIDGNVAASSHADEGGGGIFISDQSESDRPNLTLLSNSIIGGNSAAHGSDVFGKITLLYPSLVQNVNDVATHIIYGSDSDPLANQLAKKSIFGKPAGLGPLQNNGGPTLTQALSPDSPAIDQIPVVNHLCASTNATLVLTDQRGAIRIHGGSCDMGAYEHDL